MSFDVAVVYQKTWLAGFFHSFPHVDLSFESTNATFNPDRRDYREALWFWAGIPLVWCAILWLAFLVFFCVHCCKTSRGTERKQTKGTCCCFSVGCFLLLGCGALAVVFYGNAEIHEGAGDFAGAVNAGNKTIDSALGIIDTVHNFTQHVETKGIPALTEAVSGITNVTVHTKIGQLITQIVNQIKQAKTVIESMRGDVREIDTEEITSSVENAEYYRWVGTILVNCVFILVFFLTFTALLKKSKWMLISTTILSIIFMLAVWSTTSFYFILAIGGSDLCVDPNSFVLAKVNGTIKQEILVAYINCEDKTQPFQGEILEAQTSVTQAITALNMTVNMSLPFNITGKISAPVKLIRDDLKFVFGNLSSLTTLIGSCDTIHDEYVTAVEAVCHSALIGVGYVLLFSILMGLSSTVLIFCSSQIWPHFGKRRCRGDDYSQVDDTDPFLPNPSRPPPYGHNYGSIGEASFIGDSRAQTGAIRTHDDERPLMSLGPQGESPPPAYHPGHFMQQYYSLAPTPTNVAQSQHSS